MMDLSLVTSDQTHKPCIGRCSLNHWTTRQVPVIYRVCMLSRFSRVRLFVILWTVIHQGPLSMGFSRQEYWNGLPCPSPGALPNPGI